MNSVYQITGKPARGGENGGSILLRKVALYQRFPNFYTLRPL
jgi:hypothetical protein